jgi:hypothetical protein
MCADESVAAVTFLYILKLELVIYLVLLSYMTCDAWPASLKSTLLSAVHSLKGSHK